MTTPHIGTVEMETLVKYCKKNDVGSISTILEEHPDFALGSGLPLWHAAVRKNLQVVERLMQFFPPKTRGVIEICLSSKTIETDLIKDHDFSEFDLRLGTLIVATRMGLGPRLQALIEYLRINRDTDIISPSSNVCDGRSIMYTALVSENRMTMFEVLLRKVPGAAESLTNNRVLFLALSDGFIDAFKYFIERDASILQEKDERGFDILQAACLAENFELCEYLLELKSPYLEAPGISWLGTLNAGIQSSKGLAVDWIIKQCPHLSSSEEVTNQKHPQELADMRSHFSSELDPPLELIIPQRFRDAAGATEVDEVEAFSVATVAIGEIDAVKEAPKQVPKSLEEGMQIVVEKLFQECVVGDITKVKEILHEHEEVVPLLVNVHSQNGETLLHSVIKRAKRNTIDIFYLLLENGFQATQCDDSNGSSVLECVLKAGYSDEKTIELAVALLSRGATLTSQNKLGWTAMHVAAYFSSVGIFRMLVSYDPGLVRIKEQTSSGQTCLQLAEKSKNMETVAYIKQLLLQASSHKSSRRLQAMKATGPSSTESRTTPPRIRRYSSDRGSVGSTAERRMSILSMSDSSRDLSRDALPRAINTTGFLNSVFANWRDELGCETLDHRGNFEESPMLPSSRASLTFSEPGFAVDDDQVWELKDTNEEALESISSCSEFQAPRSRSMSRLQRTATSKSFISGICASTNSADRLNKVESTPNMSAFPNLSRFAAVAVRSDNAEGLLALPESLLEIAAAIDAEGQEKVNLLSDVAEGCPTLAALALCLHSLDPVTLEKELLEVEAAGDNKSELLSRTKREISQALARISSSISRCKDIGSQTGTQGNIVAESDHISAMESLQKKMRKQDENHRKVEQRCQRVIGVLTDEVQQFQTKTQQQMYSRSQWVSEKSLKGFDSSTIMEVKGSSSRFNDDLSVGASPSREIPSPKIQLATEKSQSAGEESEVSCTKSSEKEKSQKHFNSALSLGRQPSSESSPSNSSLSAPEFLLPDMNCPVGTIYARISELMASDWYLNEKSREIVALQNFQPTNLQKSVEVKLKLAELLLHIGRFNESGEVLLKASALTSKQWEAAECFFMQGRAYEQQGKYADAELKYAAVVDIDSLHLRAILSLAIVRVKMGKSCHEFAGLLATACPKLRDILEQFECVVSPLVGNENSLREAQKKVVECTTMLEKKSAQLDALKDKLRIEDLQRGELALELNACKSELAVIHHIKRSRLTLREYLLKVPN